MTTYIPFVPNPTGAFQANVTLDNAPYTLVINWGLFGQRWYANLYDQNGNRIFTLPLIGSVDPISTASVTWDALSQKVTVTTATNHNIPIGAVFDFVLSGVTPSTYNGSWRMAAQSRSSLSFPLSTDPGGSATVQGAIVHNIDLLAGYGFTSTLVYRQSSGNIEVTP